MATKANTTKKTTAKKPAAKRPVAKKTTAKKAPVKQSSKKQVEMESFHMYPEDVSQFTKVRFTKQTVYWAILLGFIALTQLWILQIQLEIAELTNAALLAG